MSGRWVAGREPAVGADHLIVDLAPPGLDPTGLCRVNTPEPEVLRTRWALNHTQRRRTPPERWQLDPANALPGGHEAGIRSSRDLDL